MVEGVVESEVRESAGLVTCWKQKMLIDVLCSIDRKA
jgi:hypothetical protein